MTTKQRYLSFWPLFIWVWERGHTKNKRCPLTTWHTNTNRRFRGCRQRIRQSYFPQADGLVFLATDSWTEPSIKVLATFVKPSHSCCPPSLQAPVSTSRLIDLSFYLSNLQSVGSIKKRLHWEHQAGTKKEVYTGKHCLKKLRLGWNLSREPYAMWRRLVCVYKRTRWKILVRGIPPRLGKCEHIIRRDDWNGLDKIQTALILNFELNILQLSIRGL